ncbi:uncharacterized protein CXQ87_003145 [Candidozyma duobushaemuli]|uniref:BHLH domain-containing protein n=2 Tax=Candidozyma TaxID=3303203 RepID=A0ABX8I608_9ASCO|nr:uncharacterized protein CXQ87_003145 [[Candida] duobushaemulonis]PVH15307.1 hypothetical protein CXQ87_003145 [[Candida] duobushaemulonis]QWU88544.1 hypothetical protein CA3LBN_002852 [[Candida] haemuloni]
MVNKRESSNSYVDGNKKVKLDNGKKEDIAIDSELLGDQSSYTNSGNQDQNDVKDEEAAVAAAASLVSEADPANAAAAALSHQQQSHHHNHHHQQQQQQQQQQQSHALHHRMYENAYGSSVHAAASQQHHRPDSTMLQPTTLPPVNNSKPPHGSDEWHRVRRENHKEVERRRRDSINAGIKDLAALIPTPDTNKAQILQRAVEFIKRLKENENNNIEKWTLEKLLTEQAVSELNASNEKLKAELERAYREIDSLRRQLDEKQ